MTNRHPVDELADIRAVRRRIDTREAELRDILLADGADLNGDDYRARISKTTPRYLNRSLSRTTLWAPSRGRVLPAGAYRYHCLDKKDRKSRPEKPTENVVRL
jgi:hypothetical protein